MKKTIKEYVLQKYVDSLFAEKFCQKGDKITDMFISIGKKFGYEDGKMKPIDPSDYYFYDMITSLGTFNVCYLGYDNVHFSGIYMTKDKKIISMDFRTHKAKYLDVKDLNTSQYEKFNGYDDVVLDSNEYLLLDVIDNKNYFYDINGTVVDEDKQEILEDNVVYQRCQDRLNALIKTFR